MFVSEFQAPGTQDAASLYKKFRDYIMKYYVTIGLFAILCPLDTLYSDAIYEIEARGTQADFLFAVEMSQ